MIEAMAINKTLEIPVCEQVVAALRDALGKRLIAVVLFGSRARGEAAPESDWDFLVIAEGLPERALQRHISLKKLLPPGCRGASSLLAKTPDELDAHMASLYLDIALDGNILYDPQLYAAERLNAWRRLIEEAGLYRKRTAAGDLWQWKRQPAAPWKLDWQKGHLG